MDAHGANNKNGGSNRHNLPKKVQTSLVLRNPLHMIRWSDLAESDAESQEKTTFAAALNDVEVRLKELQEAKRQRADKTARAASTEFYEESLKRGYGSKRPVAPIRDQSQKARAYKGGFIFALALAFFLGFINASQVIDDSNIDLPWMIKYGIIGAVVGVSLAALEKIAAAFLTAVLDLGSFDDQGARTLRKWFFAFGVLFFGMAVPSLVLRSDVGLPEAAGYIFFLAWEMVTVAIAALAQLAGRYYAWSDDLSRKYDGAVDERDRNSSLKNLIEAEGR